MFSEFQPDNSIRRLLQDEQEYFSSLIKTVDLPSNEENINFREIYKNLLNSRKKLLESLAIIDIDEETGHKKQVDRPDNLFSSKSYLTHNLIIIDARIHDLLQLNGRR